MSLAQMAAQAKEYPGVGREYPSEPVERVYEITQVLSRLQDAVCIYDRLTGHLSSRLMPVLRGSEPKEQTKSVSGYQTSLANELNILNIQITNINEALDSIIERLEI